ncbi:MAG: GlxA family transcriptional regulator, partial [Rhizobiaceae bacterium]
MKDESTSIFRPEGAPLPLTFMVLPGSSLMCVASAIDPLRAANRIAGSPVFEWRVVSCDGLSPATSAALPIPVAGALDDRLDDGRVIVAIGGFGIRDFLRPQ